MSRPFRDSSVTRSSSHTRGNQRPSECWPSCAQPADAVSGGTLAERRPPAALPAAGPLLGIPRLPPPPRRRRLLLHPTQQAFQLCYPRSLLKQRLLELRRSGAELRGSVITGGVWKISAR